MDATVAASLTTQLTQWKTDAITNFGNLIPIALAVVITVGIAFFLVKAFRGFIHM